MGVGKKDSRDPALRSVSSGGDGEGPPDPVERQYQAADRALKGGNSDLAKEILDRVLKDHPTHFRSLMLQTAIALAKGHSAKSEMYARAAIKVLPSSSVISLDRAVALSQLVAALMQQGKLDEAAVYRKMLGKANEQRSLEGGRPVSDGFSSDLESRAKDNTELADLNVAQPKVDSMVKDAVKSSGDRNRGVVSNLNPRIEQMVTSPLWKTEELQERKVVYLGMKQREVLNAFREVRIRLLQNQPNENMVVMVSSLKSKGGGSFFAFNLAVTFALDIQKTALYIDCNPYESASERYVSGEIDMGLSHYLKDERVKLDQIIYPSGVDRLRVIPSGTNNESAAELFNSLKMKNFIEEVKSRYPDRFIILDAPSIESSTEARTLAQHCDQALLLVPFGKATSDEVMSGVEAVGKNRFAGLVFNH